MTDTLSDLIVATGAVNMSERAEERAVIGRVTTNAVRPLRDEPVTSLVRTAQLLEGEGLVDLANREALFGAAFSCWRDVVTDPAFNSDELDGDLLRADLSLAFHAAVSGTLSRRATEVRQVLAQQLPDAASLQDSQPASPEWGSAVLHDTALAIVLLTRKEGGWADIALALGLLHSLRERQQQFEADFLADEQDGRTAAVRLVAYYHLAQMATLSGRYIETGEGAASGLLVRLDTHLSQANHAIEHLVDGRLARIAALLHAQLQSLVRHSIWTQIEGLGEGVAQLVANLARRDSPTPTLELWPSQEAAMNRNFLDSYRRAVIVEMPTSAGKTLLAKFAIVQTFALSKNSTIAYVVPTRVLVNQVTDELRRDLAPLEMTVEQAVPVFDLDPTENRLLETPPSVLVTTPEKLDLLIRGNHASLQNLSLVVVDEAHNIADGSRGARLELVLATIRRDRPNARYLLLSPFVPNAQDLVSWLGDDRGLAPIRVEWKPNKRVVGALDVQKINNRNQLVLTAVSAVDNSDLPVGTQIELGPVSPMPTTLKAISLAAATLLRHRGPTLIICGGKSYAAERAMEIARTREQRQLSDFGEAVIRHTLAELGPNNAMAYALRHGVAYHHAGVSMETRRFVEVLMRREEIDTICGTTTLAQGVNFPLTNVIVEDRRKGRDGDLSYADFWNIAGRAGRGMMSDLGVVAFPVKEERQRDGWSRFFEGEATSIASQLTDVVAKAATIGTTFDRAAIRRTPNLSSFLQYLAHALKVSGSLQAANEIEDLLRSSFVFRQVQEESPESARRLVDLCRAYLSQIRGESGLVALADGTGFSTPTIRAMLMDAQGAPGVTDRTEWEPDLLFGPDLEPLTTRIAMIGDLPEMSLSDLSGGPFNAARIAKIIRDWVNGEPVNTMADRYGDQSKTPLKRQAAFSGYLHSKLAGLTSWGMGALESVALAGSAEGRDSDAGHVPSMILFGVNKKEAVWLRMAGLTREAATGAAKLWQEQQRPEPESFVELRSWVTGLNDHDWGRAIPDSPLRGDDMRLLWKELHA